MTLKITNFKITSASPRGQWVKKTSRPTYESPRLRLWLVNANHQKPMTLCIYRPRHFQLTWFGVNRPSGCGVTASAISVMNGRMDLCPWTCPCGPDGQMTITLHIYRPRRFQWTWFGVNGPKGCWVPASAKFQEPLLCPWLNDLEDIGQGQRSLHATHPFMLVIIWAKHGKNPSRTARAVERTP